MQEDAVPPPDPRLATKSNAFAKTLMDLGHWATFDSVIVLLEGESGTGKTLLAQHVHQMSPRKHRTFHRVDLGAINDELAASELFGHVKGAFTGADEIRHGRFASASGGTLFIDEIGKASMRVQRLLLHATEYGEVTPLGTEQPARYNVRQVIATNVPLEKLVEQGLFLPDLMYRIGIFRAVVPPLRERRQDIPLLAACIVKDRAERFGYDSQNPPSIDEELLEVLTEQPWRGNVRELGSVLEYLLASARLSPALSLKHCTGDLAKLARKLSPRDRALHAVQTYGGVIAAARHTGRSRSTIQRWMKQPPDDTGSSRKA